MSAPVAAARPITVAILAMGGEGGGVLADWIVDVGEEAGYTTQSTSVAGVAQRTGATVYYVELFPKSQAPAPGSARTEPVLSLFPAPGDVDVVIASELMEAGRAVQRGFCTPDRTTLIVSTNRVYAISEKIALGDGRVESASLLDAARAGARTLIAADFNEMALQEGSVISSSLFGAFARSGALPLARERFEEALRRSGKAVDRSLAAFARGFEGADEAVQADQGRAATPPPKGLGPVRVTIGRRPPEDPRKAAADAEAARHRELAVTDPRALVGPRLAGRMDAVVRFPEAARSMLIHGCVRTALYQNLAYTDLYLSRVAVVARIDAERGDDEAVLTVETARHTALWMSYQDTIQVAHQKLRARRLDGVRSEAKATEGQLTQIREFLHPQLDEITAMLPAALGAALSRSRPFAKLVAAITRNGMILNTTSVVGYSALWLLAALRPIRPRSLRFGQEQKAIEAWLALIAKTATVDYALACEVARCARVLKGYGQTHEHGSQSFAVLMDCARRLVGTAGAAETLAGLSTAAMADEDGAALTQAVSRLP